MRDFPAAPVPAFQSQASTCFPGVRPQARQLAPASYPLDFTRLLGIAPRASVGLALIGGLDERARHALAILMPHLLCGEESATIAFSGFRDTARGRADASGAAARAGQVWNGIAIEECYHEYMLSHLIAALDADALPGAARNKRRAALFFLHLKSSDAITHFARIAALDGFVSRVLAAMQQRQTALYGQAALMAMLGKIRTDESRHVALTRHYLLEMDVPLLRLRSERAWVATHFRDFIGPYLGTFDALQVDPDLLLRSLH